MANRFNNIFNDRYVSTYTPLPLDAISNLAKDYSTRYRTAQDDLNKLGDLAASVNAIDQHQGYKQEFLQGINNRIDDLSSRYAKGEDINSLNREFNKLKREFISSPIRNELETSYSNYQAYQKDKIAKGDKYAPYYDTYPTFQGSTADNKINPYRYTGMGEIQDHQKLAQSMMDNIAKDGSLREGFNFDKDGNVISIKKGYEGITKDKVRKIARDKADAFLLTKEGKDFASMINYYNPKVDLNKAAEEYLYKTGEEQIFSNTSIGQEFDYAPEYINKAKQPKEQPPEYYLPSFEGNLDTQPTTNKQALASLGFNPTYLNDDGSIKYNKTQGSPIEQLKKAQRDLDNANRLYKGNESNPAYMQELDKARFNLINAQNNQKIANQHYSDLVRVANNLNVNLDSYKGKDGKIDYTKLQNDVTDIGKSINTQATSIQGLQANFADDLSKFYFGKTDAEGRFVNSPFFQKLQVYEHNNPSTKDQLQSDEITKDLAQSGRFIGLDFNDSNVGAMNFTATEGKDNVEPKLYTAVTPDKVLKTLMTPVHQFTQDYKQAQSGKQSKDDLANNKRIITSNINGLSQLIANSNDPNKQQKLTTLNSLLSSVKSQNKGLVVGTNNDQDKIFIAQPTFVNGQPQDRVIVIDVKTGTVNSDTYNLGKVQNEESTNIQNKLAPAYNQSAQGYENKEIKYR